MDLVFSGLLGRSQSGLEMDVAKVRVRHGCIIRHDRDCVERDRASKLATEIVRLGGDGVQSLPKGRIDVVTIEMCCYFINELSSQSSKVTEVAG